MAGTTNKMACPDSAKVPKKKQPLFAVYHDSPGNVSSSKTLESLPQLLFQQSKGLTSPGSLTKHGKSVLEARAPHESTGDSRGLVPELLGAIPSEAAPWPSRRGRSAASP